jgi:O-succinylbenzoic acid--CoA ligase
MPRPRVSAAEFVADPAATLAAGGEVVVATSGSTGTAKRVVLSAAALIAGAELSHARLGGPGRWLTAVSTETVAGLMCVVRGSVGGGGWGRVASDLGDLVEPQSSSCAELAESQDLPALRSCDSGAGLVPRRAPARRMTGIHAARTYLSLVPTQLVRALERPALTAALARLDAVLVGGAALDPAVRSRAEAAGINVVRTYGMTETAGGVVYDGVPLDGVTVGFRGGRITLTTPTCFTEYEGDAEATAAVRQGHTFLTSDRGRFEEGRLVVTGRSDDVVQSGGVNVDLAELQRLADAAFGADEIVVFAVPDSVWGARMMAAATRPVSVDEIIGRLGGRITSAARPRGVLLVPAFPLTASGKPDRRRLAELWQEGKRGDSA